MKKLIWFLVFVFSFVFSAVDVYARTGSRRSTIRVYGTTGGAAGDLDAVECEDIRGDDAAITDPLRDDDVAWGIITTAGAHPQIYFWAFDEDVDETNCTGANEPWDFCTGAGTGTFAEDDPRLILPDDIADCTVTAGEGAWVLAETYYLGRVATPSQVFRDADAVDTDDNATVAVNCTDTGSGTEDCDYTITVQIAGTPTAVFTIDADGSITSGLPFVATTSVTIGSAGITEPELEILDGATISTTQLNYLTNATGTTGTNTTNVVFSTSPTLVTPNIGAATGTSLITTGLIRGLIPVTVTTAATLVLTTANTKGDLHQNGDADAIDYTLPAAAAGLSACFMAGEFTGIITIDPVDGTDTIYLNGASVGPGDAIDSPGTVGDFICLIAVDSTKWYTLGQINTWVDGGVD